MALTPEMLQKCIEEYYFDPENRGYYHYGNLLNSRNDAVFYAPQILSLANDPIIEYRITGYCPLTGGTIIEKVEHPCRTSVVLEGFTNAPNALTFDDLLEIYNYFLKISPELTNEWTE